MNYRPHHNSREREFRFTQQDFEHLRSLVNQHTGISLSEHKREMLYSRLARRLRALHLNSFAEYYHLLQSGDCEDELIQFTNAVTTNLTAFFREAHHFEILATDVLPKFIANRPNKRLRIWSAGCASGEEPYSIAMVLKETMPVGWDVKILATDLDSAVLKRGQEGIYTQNRERLHNMSEQRIRRWFKRGTGVHEGQMQIVPELQHMVSFRRLNLIHAWPMRGLFDIIFCRNVIIYFDKSTQITLFDRFADILRTDGYLFVGHSENLFKLTTRFQLVKQTTYIKIE